MLNYPWVSEDPIGTKFRHKSPCFFPAETCNPPGGYFSYRSHECHEKNQTQIGGCLVQRDSRVRPQSLTALQDPRVARVAALLTLSAVLSPVLTAPIVTLLLLPLVLSFLIPYLRFKATVPISG